MNEANTVEAGQAPAEAKAAVGETVRLEDGREVVFAGKRRMLKSTKISDDGQVTTTFDFRNGKTLQFTIPQGLVLLFAGHGAEQKIGDETAGETDVDDMVLAVSDLIERLSQGTPESWNAPRAAGGGFAGTSVLSKALVEASGKSAEQIAAFLKGKTQAEKLAMRNSAKLKPIVERLEAEKAAKASKVDTTALFDQLEAAV